MKTSSGHYAGLQSGKDFKVVEQELKRKHVRIFSLSCCPARKNAWAICIVPREITTNEVELFLLSVYFACGYTLVSGAHRLLWL